MARMIYELTYRYGNGETEYKQTFILKRHLNDYVQLGKDKDLRVIGVNKFEDTRGNDASNKIIGYCRVSTKIQLEGNSLEQQRNEILERYPAALIHEEQFSGAKDREVFNGVISSLTTGDTLVITKLDRFCRTTKEGLEYIDQLMNKGVRIHILNMGLIEDNAMGKLIVTNLLAFAEFERAMIIERTQSGKEIAKTKAGFKDGRPKTYTEKQLDNALNMLTINGGTCSYSEVTEITNISKSTLIRE
ncbi:MAG: recombinase family protein, partial [Aeromonas sp.]